MTEVKLTALQRAVALALTRKFPGQWSPGLGFPKVPIAEADAIELHAEGLRLFARRSTGYLPFPVG